MSLEASSIFVISLLHWNIIVVWPVVISFSFSVPTIEYWRTVDPTILGWKNVFGTDRNFQR